MNTICGYLDMFVFPDLQDRRVHLATEEANKDYFKAVAAGKTEEVQTLLQLGVDVNYSNSNIGNAVHLQLLSPTPNFQLINQLLKNRINIHTQSYSGHTPLHLAAIFNYMPLADKLLRFGASVNSLSYFKENPLHCLLLNSEASETDLKIMHILIERGLDLLQKNYPQNWIPFDLDQEMAIQWLESLPPIYSPLILMQSEITGGFPKIHPAINRVDGEGRTLLHWAMEKGYEKIAQLLINRGADKNAVDNYGKTPLDYSRK